MSKKLDKKTGDLDGITAETAALKQNVAVLNTGKEAQVEKISAK